MLWNQKISVKVVHFEILAPAYKDRQTLLHLLMIDSEPFLQDSASLGFLARLWHLHCERGSQQQFRCQLPQQWNISSGLWPGIRVSCSMIDSVCCFARRKVLVALLDISAVPAGSMKQFLLTAFILIAHCMFGKHECCGKLYSKRDAYGVHMNC